LAAVREAARADTFEAIISVADKQLILKRITDRLASRLWQR
jgi:hypothetical protein